MTRFLPLLALALATSLNAAEKFTLGTPVSRRATDMNVMPRGTPSEFATAISAASVGLYARVIPPGELTLELGLIETLATAPGKNLVQVAVNGTPLDAQLDVFAKAGGANRPFIFKKTFRHEGGTLALKVDGLGCQATLCYARVLGADGRVLAAGEAKHWNRPDRVRLGDARSLPYRPVAADEVVFFDTDHAPVGAWASFVYGAEASGGLMTGRKTDTGGDLVVQDGLIVAARKGGVVRAMPFFDRADAKGVAFLAGKEVVRRLGACTDSWSTKAGFSWTHYSPSHPLRDWDGATDAERRRFALPATMMEFELDNADGATPMDFLLALRQPSQRTQWKTGYGDFAGYAVRGGDALATRADGVETPDAAAVKKEFGIAGANGAFVVRVPAGMKKTVVFHAAHLVAGKSSELAGVPLMTAGAALFKDLGGVLAAAASDEDGTKKQCRATDARLDSAGLSPERRLLAAQALNTYRFNTLLFTDADAKRPVWAVLEGECAFLNTLDLTVDHAFLELALHPWTVRNELDLFAKHYAYRERIAGPGGKKAGGALSFNHDMGKGWRFSKPGSGAAYGEPMSQEELQNWLACAALYFHATGDKAWLEGKRALLAEGLESMFLRDDTDPAARDGITTLRSERGEITTYDAMDDSLKRPTDNLYIAVKSFGVYLSLAPVFDALGDGPRAAECRAAAARTAKGVDAHFDEKAGCFPALFGAKSRSHIIPAVEGLVYPYAMGLRAELAPDGPYGSFVRHLRRHLETILKPGVCLDRETGAWLLSDSSANTWESKVYLNQTVAEEVLGIRDDRTGGPVDKAHLAYQALGSPCVGWTCQITTRDHVAWGCRHYPRGVTSALWWIAKPSPGPGSPSTSPSR